MRTELIGSQKPPVSDAKFTSVGPVHPDTNIRVTVWMKRGHYAGPSVDAITAFCQRHGLQAEYAGGRKVHVTGPVKGMEAAFGTKLEEKKHVNSAKTIRARTGSLSIPTELAPIIQTVLGLDNRPVASPKYRINRSKIARTPGSAAPYFTGPQLASIYNAPNNTGTGRTIGILCLGGGIQLTYLQTYFKRIGVAMPNVRILPILGATNSPDGLDGADGENYLDIEAAGGMAPGSTIVIVIAPNSDQGYSEAIDTINQMADVGSSSWGSEEASWTADARSLCDSLFEEGVTAGTTWFAAAGDGGSSDGGSGDNVDYPASSPYVVGVGGTKLQAIPATGQIISETVWNDLPSGGATGGGWSADYPAPSYQAGYQARGVPDVAAVASPETGLLVEGDGQTTIIGGTSLAAPLWAGGMALVQNAIGARSGNILPAIYANQGQCCNPITDGNNGSFEAGPGNNRCCGWGSPNFTKIAAVLAAAISGQPPPATTVPPPAGTTPPVQATGTITLSGLKVVSVVGNTITVQSGS